MNLTDQFETIVNEYYEALFRFAMSLTRVESDAEDLTQQTFYVWARKGHQLRDISKVKTWLFTTLHREFLITRRRQSRFFHQDLEEVAGQLPALTPALADHVDSSQVIAALAKVDEVFQPAVALFYMEDCPYKDIASILEVPIGTVKSRIARGIAQLRNILLPGDSEAAARKANETLPGPMEDKPAAPAESTVRRSHVQLAASAEGGYAEWDLSSTLLPELIVPH